MYNVPWFNVYGLEKVQEKHYNSTYKKVVTHLQVPVMCVKWKYKVPNLLGNKKQSGFNLNYCVLEVGFGYGFSKK